MRSIQNLLGEAKGKMNGYVTLLMLRYGNLCVKADATSLLSASININGKYITLKTDKDEEYCLYNDKIITLGERETGVIENSDGTVIEIDRKNNF